MMKRGIRAQQREEKHVLGQEEKKLVLGQGVPMARPRGVNARVYCRVCKGHGHGGAPSSCGKEEMGWRKMGCGCVGEMEKKMKIRLIRFRFRDKMLYIGFYWVSGW